MSEVHKAVDELIQSAEKSGATVTTDNDVDPLRKTTLLSGSVPKVIKGEIVDFYFCRLSDDRCELHSGWSLVIAQFKNDQDALTWIKQQKTN